MANISFHFLLTCLQDNFPVVFFFRQFFKKKDFIYERNKASATHDLKVGYNKDGVLNEKIEIAKDGSKVTRDMYNKDGKSIFLCRTFESEILN